MFDVNTDHALAAGRRSGTHSGPPADADRAYGTLAAYAARHALAVDGPIREYYLVGQRDTPDTSRWRTEIGWPVFQIGASAGT